MKKYNLAIAILIAVVFFGIFLRAYTHYHFFAGCCTGGGAVLVLMATLGRWQAKKAAAIIDKKVADNYRQMQAVNEILNKEK